MQIDGWNLVWQGSAGDWRWRSDLELLEARNRTPGANFERQLARRADQQLAISLERAWGDAWWLGAHALLQSERFDDAANTRRLAGYGKLDLSVEHQLAPDWRLQLRLNNVGDKRYETAPALVEAARAVCHPQLAAGALTAQRLRAIAGGSARTDLGRHEKR